MSSSTKLSNPAFDSRASLRLESAPVPPEAGLRIGYLPRRDGAEEALLRRAGCGAVRIEGSAEGGVLVTLLAFLAPGDLLVLPSVRSLPREYGGLQRLLSELDARGLAAAFLTESLRTDGEDGLWLRRAAAAAAQLRAPVRSRRPTAEIRAKALELRGAGVSPGQIARALRVSRMTVWRWLKAAA